MPTKIEKHTNQVPKIICAEKKNEGESTVCQTYLALLLSFSFSLSLLGSLPVGEKQSQESYGKTQATQNEGQNPCASKDAAAVAGAAVAETREGQEEQKVREGERANEKKQRYLRRKGGVQRSGRERKRLRETRRACKREKQREKERKRERGGGKERLA